MRIKHIVQWYRTIGIITGLLGLTACANLNDAAQLIHGTQVNTAHHLISQEGEEAFATVYFLRPKTERPMGFADNSIKIELDGLELLSIAKGEYTLLYMRPRVRTTLTVVNLTEKGRFKRTTQMQTNYEFAFAAGQTYFIMLEPVDGEFRGVHFLVNNVDLFHAKEAADKLRPVGAATSAPISTL